MTWATRRRLTQGLFIAFASALLVLWVFPIVWAVVVALKSESEVLAWLRQLPLCRRRDAKRLAREGSLLEHVRNDSNRALGIVYMSGEDLSFHKLTPELLMSRATVLRDQLDSGGLRLLSKVHALPDDPTSGSPLVRFIAALLLAAAAGLVVGVASPVFVVMLLAFAVVVSVVVLLAPAVQMVALSVVGCDRLPDSGYFRAKVAQEVAVKVGPVPYTIVRATPFFEAIGQIADARTDGDTVRVPPDAWLDLDFAMRPDSWQLPGDGAQYIVSDGPAKGMKGYFVRSADGTFEAVHLGGRLATRVKNS